MNDQVISFNARFSGVPMFVYVPINAVNGIYARENGRGMMFDQEEYEPEPPIAPAPVRPALRVIK
jgi:stringent starvation protein B